MTPTASAILAIITALVTAIEHVLTAKTVDAPSSISSPRERYEAGKKAIYDK